MKRLLTFVISTTAFTAFSTSLWAGAPGGDLSKQKPTYHIDHIPPAPVLSAEDELKSFKLPPGFHAELVAAEPMVEEPIALTFDPDGRIYVVELRGYMPDMAGTGELDPVGRIVRLESSKGDGHYDKSTIFLDKLIVPRAVGLAGDGVMVAEPPNLYFCRDTHHDGHCDQKTIIAEDYGRRAPNPEHMANGLTWAIDNCYYNADFSFRFKFSKGAFVRESTISRGQWGIAQDDIGRLFYNTNGSLLRCELMPAAFLTRNPYLNSPAGVNIAIASNATHPARVNPGVNRGYTADCDANGKLQRVTASCGPVIYRADQFPPEYRGNAFVCEPAGNLVSRQVIEQKGVMLAAKCAQHDGIDFFCSTDERFRPVSLYIGPDGAMYVVDLYHGIVQHGAYLSAYLADQVKKRDLDNNDGHRGRIWRIVSDAAAPGHQPHLSDAPSADLVKNLSNANGWWRDTSQRLLVERNEVATARLLMKVIAGEAPGATPLAKVHALWALAGMEKLDDDTAAAALKDADPRVRMTAIRAADMLIHKHLAPFTAAGILKIANDPDDGVQLQILATASSDVMELAPAASAILARHLDDSVFRCAAVNGATGRELDLAQALLASPEFAKGDGKVTHELLNELAECIVRSRSSDHIEKLLELVAGLKDAPSQQAMMSGVVDALIPHGKGKTTVAPRRLRLPHEPAALTALLASADKKVADMSRKAEAVMSWPNKPGDTTPPLRPLTVEQEKRFAGGQVLFSQICAQCHQPSGLGQDGIAPPLVDSEWVLGREDRLARIVLHGLHGPIKVGKKTMDLEMPGLGALNDEQIASILTYLRREWGHEANPVEPKNVAAVRRDTGERGNLQWTADELLKVK